MTKMYGGNTPIVPDETIEEWKRQGLLSETPTLPEMIEVNGVKYQRVEDPQNPKKHLMTKVVYNACYGEFGLSKEACQRYFDIKGQQVWIEKDAEYKALDIFTVWLVSPNERVKQLKQFSYMSMDERREYNQKVAEQIWHDRYVERHDPVLVQVVEELGEKAGTKFAKLAIAEVTGPYRIDEYDGFESVKVPDSYDWITP